MDRALSRREGKAATLAGRRILVAEDELLICMDLESILSDAGCIVVGPATDLDQAMALARGAPIDAAVLDINLDGRTVFPAAEILFQRDIPFLFASGYSGELVVPEGLSHMPRIRKPYSEDAILGALRALLSP